MPTERAVEIAREAHGHQHDFTHPRPCEDIQAKAAEAIDRLCAQARAEEREAIGAEATEWKRKYEEADARVRELEAETTYNIRQAQADEIDVLEAATKALESRLAIAVEALEIERDHALDQGFKYIAESLADALAKIKGE